MMLKSHYADVARNQDNHWWYMGMAFINSTLISKFVTKRKRIRILDAGCGPGAMLPTLRKFGDVTGMDLSADALKYARKRGKVIKGDITKLKFKSKSFDMIICMDVLYHSWVKDVDAVLVGFGRVLKPKGFLLIREPAYNWMRGNEDRGSMTARRFSSSELTKMLKKSGYKIIRISYANFFLFPLVLIVRILTKLGVGKGSSDMSLPPVWLNKLFFGILRTEAKLITENSLPWGSSLICLAQKV